eukprot:749068-Hanusia_phi.AAC.2
MLLWSIDKPKKTVRGKLQWQNLLVAGSFATLRLCSGSCWFLADHKEHLKRMRLPTCNFAFLSLGVILLFDAICEGVRFNTLTTVADRRARLCQRGSPCCVEWHPSDPDQEQRCDRKTSCSYVRFSSDRTSSIRNVFLPPGGIPPVDDDYEETPKKTKSPASPGQEPGRRQSDWDDRNTFRFLGARGGGQSWMLLESTLAPSRMPALLCFKPISPGASNSPLTWLSPVTGSSLESPDELNERLRPTGLDRHRFEGVLSDTLPIHKSAWTKVPAQPLAGMRFSAIRTCQVAEEMNLRIPEENDVKMAMTMPAEKVSCIFLKTGCGRKLHDVAVVRRFSE